jgi:hypothetical protein
MHQSITSVGIAVNSFSGDRQVMKIAALSKFFNILNLGFQI